MSCQDVCVVMDYDECNDFYAERMQRARKAHRCCECGDEIPAGATHERASGKADGEMWSVTSCAPCVEIRRAFSCGTWLFGELWNAIAEQFFPDWNEMIAIDCLAKLTSEAAVAKVREQYTEWRGEEEDLARPAVAEPQEGEP